MAPSHNQSPASAVSPDSQRQQQQQQQQQPTTTTTTTTTYHDSLASLGQCLFARARAASARAVISAWARSAVTTATPLVSTAASGLRAVGPLARRSISAAATASAILPSSPRENDEFVETEDADAVEGFVGEGGFAVRGGVDTVFAGLARRREWVVGMDWEAVEREKGEEGEEEEGEDELMRNGEREVEVEVEEQVGGTGKAGEGMDEEKEEVEGEGEDEDEGEDAWEEVPENIAPAELSGLAFLSCISDRVFKMGR